MTEKKAMLRPAIKPTRPIYSHLETEWLMEIILASGHEQADHLVGKLVKYADEPEVYAKLQERVRAHLAYTRDDCGQPPVKFHPPGDLRRLVMERHPKADRFGMAGVPGPGQQWGITFSTGPKRWHFATPDGHVGDDALLDRAAAQDAFDAYWKPAKQAARPRKTESR